MSKVSSVVEKHLFEEEPFAFIVGKYEIRSLFQFDNNRQLVPTAKGILHYDRVAEYNRYLNISKNELKNF